MYSFFLFFSIVYLWTVYGVELYINYMGYWPMYWAHRGKIYQLTFGPASSARRSKNINMGLKYDNGILIKHFKMDEKECNTDTFDISKLYFFRTSATYSIRKHHYKHTPHKTSWKNSFVSFPNKKT